MTDAGTLLEREQKTTDPDFTRTHIVNCPEDKPDTATWLTEARVMGLEVEAVCGYRWVPTRDPERFPLCEACVVAANMIVAEVNGDV
jgi:hypothetical protein